VALSSRNRRALAVLAGVAVAGAAAVVFVLFMGGGGEEPQQAAAPATQTPTTPKTTPKKQAKPNKPAKKRAPTFAFFGGRDPFVPLVVAETGGAGANTSGAINAVDAPSGGTQTADATVVGGNNVSLIDINGDNVQVSVDGQTHTVQPGDQFEGNFELVSVSGGCANFLYGDQSFTLCEAGERK
jgi:hypothetical protein